MKALNDYDKATGGKPTVEGALHAFLDTDLDLYIEGGEGWKNYAALSAQVANTPEWGAMMMDQPFDPVVLRLIGLLTTALPDRQEEYIRTEERRVGKEGGRTVVSGCSPYT